MTGKPKKDPPPARRDPAPKAPLPTREREQKEQPEQRQLEKVDKHPLNEDPDFPARPR
jgi:hypothetical protein